MNKIIKITEDFIFVGTSDGKIIQTERENASWDVKIGDEVDIYSSSEITILCLSEKKEDEKLIESLIQGIDEMEISQIHNETTQSEENVIEKEITSPDTQVINNISQPVEDQTYQMVQPVVQQVNYQQKVRNNFLSRLVKKCRLKMIVCLSIIFAILFTALLTICVLPKGKKYTGEFILYGRTIQVEIIFKDNKVELSAECDEIDKSEYLNNNGLIRDDDSLLESDEDRDITESVQEVPRNYEDEIIKEILGTDTCKYKIEKGKLYIYDTAFKRYYNVGTISSTKIEMDLYINKIILTEHTFSKLKTVSKVFTIVLGVLDLLCLSILMLNKMGIINSEE